jgi:predicted transcriptional regulator of viral defense system
VEKDNRSLAGYIKELDKPFFTTNEISAFSGKSPSTVSQTLKYLEREKIVFKVFRGIWAETGHKKLSPYSVIPLLLPGHRGYASFTSALHMHGIIEQIPQEITVASTDHTKKIKTAVVDIHRLTPGFFKGFGWYKGSGDFLIAEPEKALVDSLYLSSCRKKSFGYFPELEIKENFSKRRAEQWVSEIPNQKLRVCVGEKLKRVLALP